MAFSTNGGGYGSRRRNRGGSSLSEINVTPFVDVVLVLLIIFMLTAHVMDYGIEVEVPQTTTVKDTSKELPVINIQKDGTTYVNDKPVNIHDLASTIRQKFGKPDAVYVRADKETIYDVIAQVADQLQTDGLKINLVTQPIDNSRKGAR
ncbi:MAG TPA: biopolymer transporter ExbD [Bryobacteraceae bacterium]|jgi:biopolymer transport protein ExbD|nr:biopolymer transporter ExbD [Bryobacteraceae bacterium]